MVEVVGETSVEPARTLSLRQMEVFWAIMRSGNQHEAARLLGLSQPAVSKALRYAEDRIGVTFFHRIKGRLQPTAEAKVFFRVVDDIFSRLESAERLAWDLRRPLAGRITVTSTAALADVFVAGALGPFLRSHPLLKAGLKVLPPAQVVERVAHGEADLGVTFGPVDPAAVETHVLCRVPIICAVPADHRLAGHEALTVHDLDGERLISATTRPIWGKLVEDAFAAAGARADIAVVCTQSDTAFGLAEAAAGIAVVPSFPARPGVAAALRVRLLQPAISIPVVAVTQIGLPVPNAVQSLIEELVKTAGRTPWLPQH